MNISINPDFAVDFETAQRVVDPSALRVAIIGHGHLLALLACAFVYISQQVDYR